MKDTLQDVIKRKTETEKENPEQTDAEMKKRIHRQERGRRRRVAIRRKKERRRNVLFAIIVVMVLLIFAAGKIGGCKQNTSTENRSESETEEQSTILETANTAEETESVTYTIEAPQKRKKAEVYRILKKYAKKDSKMAQLYEDRKSYPVNLLNKVINNPEMTDFVLSYPDAEDKVTGGITKKEKKADFPLFLQWDSRWAYVSYGDSNIGLAGCGPTCLSMVIFSLTRNEKATPDALASYSEENGYYVDGVGTSWLLMTAAAAEYGVMAQEIVVSKENMMTELDAGHMLICSVGAGDFTTEGHFIVIYGYSNQGFFVNDPYCRARSEKKWTYERLSEQIRTIWTYSD